MQALMAMVISIATIYNIPPYLMVAMAELESDWIPTAIHVNEDGTVDRGLMQLNSSWYNENNWMDPHANITAAAEHIIVLKRAGLNWYQVAIAYNCGLGRFYKGPPPESIDYAVRVFTLWEQRDRGFKGYVGQ
jgi:soluble lytic murein transglycosylase-like protein